jgi:hypothetical protein
MTVVETALRKHYVPHAFEATPTANRGHRFLLENPVISRFPSNSNHADSTEVTKIFKLVKQLASSSTAKKPGITLSCKFEQNKN